MLQTAPNPMMYLKKALKRLLKPLVRFLIYSGITYPELSELFKELFVEVADSEFVLKGKKQTDSRINFLTGIHRKDIKRLKSQTNCQGVSTTTHSLGALIISRWLGDPDYCDKQGNPRALPRLMRQGGAISFEGLVVSINKDIRSRAILDEWFNMNIVFRDDNGYICLDRNAFIPEKGYEEKAWFFGENLHDHIASAAHNLKGDSAPYLERAVFYDQLTEKSALELAELSEKLGMEVLIKINSHALALQNKDKQNKNLDYRMRMGLFFYKAAENNDLKVKQKKD